MLTLIIIVLTLIIASETWALCRLLPMLIGDLVPEESEHWKLFILFLDIVQKIMAPKCTVGLAAYLRELIHQHHSTFIDCYPNRSLTPKLHYIIHIPKWMIQ